MILAGLLEYPDSCWGRSGLGDRRLDVGRVVGGVGEEAWWMADGVDSTMSRHCTL